MIELASRLYKLLQLNNKSTTQFFLMGKGFVDFLKLIF